METIKRLLQYSRGEMMVAWTEGVVIKMARRGWIMEIIQGRALVSAAAAAGAEWVLGLSTLTN